MNQAAPYTKQIDLLEGPLATNRYTGAGGPRLFVAYNAYRLLVSLFLLALLTIPTTRALLSGFDLPQFIAGASLLLISAIVLIGGPGRALRRSETSIFGLMLGDITAVALIASASGGIVSGFSVLYLTTVSAAAILLRTHILAILVAAIAVLAVLADTFWMVSRGDTTLGMLVPAGILGSLLFATSLLVQVLANRIVSAEAQAESAASQVQALQQLNQQIILHMQTGVVLINQDRVVSPINASASRLLNLASGASNALADISKELAAQYEAWLAEPGFVPSAFRTQDDSIPLIASFAALDDRYTLDNLIFVEDYTPVTKVAQSLKLNSLSKLTASIAHEVRNPLSAISHAAQLLSESNTIDKADAVLCRILVSNSDRVSSIIDNVIEVSRRQAPRAESLSLPAWMEGYVAEYQSQRPEPCDISMAPVAANPAIRMDAQHLKRVMSNLLDNGLRHSMSATHRSSLRIQISVEDQVGQVHVDVIDYGEGVPEKYRPRLFEPFFTTSDKGTGLGLYLCKELCEVNGVGLVYRPTPEGESAFRLSFKLEKVV